MNKFKRGDLVTLNEFGENWLKKDAKYDFYKGIRKVEEHKDYNNMLVVYRNISSINYIEATDQNWKLVDIWE